MRLLFKDFGWLVVSKVTRQGHHAFLFREMNECGVI